MNRKFGKIEDIQPIDYSRCQDQKVLFFTAAETVSIAAHVIDVCADIFEILQAQGKDEAKKAFAERLEPLMNHLQQWEDPALTDLLH